MKQLTIRSLLTLALSLAFVSPSLAQETGPLLPGRGPAAVETSVGTAFTFQGYLEDTSGPYSGTADLAFTLWDDPTASDPANQVGGTVDLAAVQVDQGLFTAELDFGSGAFGSGARYLEIAVDGTMLSPRQSLTPSPYALALPGLYTDEALPFVGIGREAPIESREYFGVQTPAGSGFGGMYVNTGDADGSPFYGYANDGQLKARHYYQSSTNAWVLRFGITDQLWVKSNGFMGLGTFNPQERLDVQGGVRTRDGLKVTAGTTDGVLVENALQAGLRVTVAGTDGVHVNSAAQDGLSVNYAGGNGLSVSTADGNGVYVDQAAGDGLRVHAAFLDGLHVADAGDHGVNARTTDSFKYGGRFVNDGDITAVPEGGGLYARSQGAPVPDLVLGANDGTDDDGRIDSDPNYTSSDLFLGSNDDVTIQLDKDNDGENADLKVLNPGGELVFNVDVGGSAWQPATAFGLAKAAALVQCDGLDSAILRRGAAPNAPLTTIGAESTDDDACYIDFNFPLTDRFWSVAMADPASGYVSCRAASGVDDQLRCYITDTCVLPLDCDAEDIMVVVF
ncbi:MAG: hypothetical protein ACK2U9_06740 [Anaerolineae bacterium]|jgi:hypothetical protein